MNRVAKASDSPCAATDTAPGLLQGVLIALSMGLVLLTLLALVLWLHRSAQESKWTDGSVEERYNEITRTLTKRSFV